MISSVFWIQYINSQCGALGRVTRVFYRCIILRVFCHLLPISDDNLFRDVSVVVQRRLWRVDYAYSLPFTSFTTMDFTEKLTGQLDFVPGGHAGVYIGRAANLLV